MKFAGTVVLYNPDREVLDNIQTYLPFIDVLYVMDNSTKDYDFLNDIKKIKKVKYISLNGNKGIAKALKVATETAIEDGFDFLLSMDQDSKFPTEDFKYVEEYLKNNDVSNLGILAINYTGSPIKNDSDNKKQTLQVNEVITSGSFLNLESYKQITGYNEELFIDLVDYDLCYQFILHNFDIFMMQNIILKHSLGELNNIKFLNYKKTDTTHSPIRYYYMYRNYHYLKSNSNKTYANLIMRIKNEYCFKRTMRRFLTEKPHFGILKMIIRGIRDGKKGILGPYQERRK